MKACRWLVLPAILLGWGLAPVHGQTSFPVPDVSFNERGEFTKLVPELRGKPDKKTQEMLEKMAKHYIWRVTQTTGALIQRERHLNELDREVVQKAMNPKPNRHFVDAFAPLLVERLKDVFGTIDIKENQIAVLYAAQMLPIVARLKHDSIDDLLITLLDEKANKANEKEKAALPMKRHPAVQHYAVMALREFFPVTVVEDNLFDDKKKERDVRRVEVLCRFIEREWPTQALDGNAIRFIRREAIASLGQVQYPAVSALGFFAKKDGFGAAEGTPVATLMNVLLKDGMRPEADLLEKYRAVEGLCKLKCDKAPDYQPELGVYLVGRFLIEYALTYNKEVNKLLTKQTVASVPWKIYSENLRKESKDDPDPSKHGYLQRLIHNTRDSAEAHKAAKQLREAALPVLSDIASYRIVNEVNLSALRGVVNTIKPKTDEFPLFKTVKGPVIKIGD